jgi:hypothetical protein
VPAVKSAAEVCVVVALAVLNFISVPSHWALAVKESRSGVLDPSVLAVSVALYQRYLSVPTPDPPQAEMSERDVSPSAETVTSHPPVASKVGALDGLEELLT